MAGHVPLVVRASAAAAAGQRSNEHLHQIREGCSTNEDIIISERRELYAGSFTAAQDDSLWGRHERMRTDGYDSETCASLAARLAAAGMWQVPTLVNERSYFLGPAGALRAATLEPACYLEATDSLGTVEANNLADLLLLDANPLEDITNTRRIAGVVLDGRFLDREALDQLLAEAERATGRTSSSSPNSGS